MTSLTMFDQSVTKTETITLRVSWEQKKRIEYLAQKKGVSMSRFIMSLVSEENHRQMTNDLYDDGLPF